MPTSEVQCAIAALGRATQSGDQSRVDAARQGLVTAKIAQYVERELAKAPPLTDEQKTRLATLLRAEK